MDNASLLTPKRKALGSNPDGCAIKKSLDFIKKIRVFSLFVYKQFLGLSAYLRAFVTRLVTLATEKRPIFLYIASFFSHCTYHTDVASIWFLAFLSLLRFYPFSDKRNGSSHMHTWKWKVMAI